MDELKDHEIRCLKMVLFTVLPHRPSAAFYTFWSVSVRFGPFCLISDHFCSVLVHSGSIFDEFMFVSVCGPFWFYFGPFVSVIVVFCFGTLWSLCLFRYLDILIGSI